MRIYRRNITLLLLLTLSIFVCRAQDENFSIQKSLRKTSKKGLLDKDFKVGLVLSGGGARALAHIGVLRVLEQEGVRIDYIGGTSMGGIIGALYASGYSVDQIEATFKEFNFEELSLKETERKYKMLYKKNNSDIYAVSLPITKKFKILAPTSFRQIQRIYNEMVKFFNPVSSITDFSKLPIPFFCVATNLGTGESEVLESGYLPKVLAASSAFPGFYAPVDIDGSMYVDGGVVNNYPIDEMKAKGVDYIIGVDVQQGLKQKDEFNQSVLDVISQVMSFNDLRLMKDKAKQTDIYVKPEVRRFSIFSFNEVYDLVMAGRLAAEEKREVFKKLAAKQKQTSEKQNLEAPDTLTIEDVYLKDSVHSKDHVLKKMSIRLPQETSFAKIYAATQRLHATEVYKDIFYEVKDENGDNRYALHLDLKPRDYQLFLKASAHYDMLYRVGVLVNITKESLFFKTDELASDFIIGDESRYNIRYYMDTGMYFGVGVNLKYSSFPYSRPYIPSQASAIFQNSFENQLYIQAIFREFSAFGMGIEHRQFRVATRYNVFERAVVYGLYGFLKIDNLDNIYFPRDGLKFDTSLTYHFQPLESGEVLKYNILKANILFAKPLSKKTSFNFEGGLGIGIDTPQKNFMNFALGGFGGVFANNYQPFYGYDYFNIAGNSYLKGALTIDYEFYKKLHLNATFNMASVRENLFSSVSNIVLPEYKGMAIGFGVDTLLGPMQLKYTWSPENTKDRSGLFFVSLGYWF